METEEQVTFVKRLLPLREELQPRGGDASLLSLPLAEDDARVLFNPFDVRALRTWAELTGRGWRGTLRSIVDLLPRLLLHLRDASPTAGFAGPLPRGLVVLLRSQKIIIADRRNGFVYHLLHPEHAQRPVLLQNEVVAWQILPRHTVPILFAHLEESPYFLVQPFLPYAPIGEWRRLLPQMDRVVSALVTFYEHCGFQTVDSDVYRGRLSRAVGDRLPSVPDESLRATTAAALAKLFRLLDEARRRLGRVTVVTTRVHGDLIPSHIVRPHRWPSERFLLVDWSESHVYSVFHDLFYFQFQNYDTDFWAFLLRSPALDLPSYFGTGHRVLWDSLRSLAAIQEDTEAFRFQMLICLLEELDHRLHRLHPRYLGFWCDQVNRL